MRMQNRSPFKPRIKAGLYRIENKAETESTVYLYDEIGFFGVMAEDFVKDLAAISTPIIHLRVNSPGGSVFDGTAIYNAIKHHPSKIVAHIDGLAASIASLAVMAADEIHMAENAFFMIHQPWSIVMGNSETMREEADLLDKVGGSIIKTYVDRSIIDEKTVIEMMDKETWMTAEEALENGFIDVVDENKKDEKARASLFDLSVFANVPAQLKGEHKQPPTARELEKILKDQGFSNKQAKEILASGYQTVVRDEQYGDVAEKKAESVQRDVVEAPQRDVVEPPPMRNKDRTAELLTKAALLSKS